MNLLQETLDALKENGKTPTDVRWVGRPKIKAKCSWREFEKQAENLPTFCDVPFDLLVVGDDWWLEREEHREEEWWEFKTLPAEPDAPKCEIGKDLFLWDKDRLMLLGVEYQIFDLSVLPSLGVTADNVTAPLESYISGEKQPAIYKFCVRASVNIGFEDFVEKPGVGKRFILKLVDDVKVRDVRFLGLVKKVVKITENIAIVSIEPVSAFEITDFPRGGKK